MCKKANIFSFCVTALSNPIKDKTLQWRIVWQSFLSKKKVILVKSSKNMYLTSKFYLINTLDTHLPEVVGQYFHLHKCRLL